MTSILNSAHSGLRWLVLLFLLISIVFAFLNLKKTKIEKPQKLMYLFGLIFTHTQLLIGLVLYFLSAKVVFNEETMSNASSRFYAMEHPLGMLIAIILINVMWQVITRYLFNSPSTITEEISRFGLIWFGFLGVIYNFL